MNILEIIEQIQEERGNQIPKVALLSPILHKCRRGNIYEMLKAEVEKGNLAWGTTPHTHWFATELSDEDRELIKERMKGWTIEEDFI